MKKQPSLSLYWKCQLAGWTAAALYWEAEAFIRSKEFNVTLGIINFAADILVNILLTDAYRRYAMRHAWHTLPPRRLLGRIIPAVLLLATGFALSVSLRFYLLDHYLTGWYQGSWPQHMADFGWTPFVTGIRIMSIWVLAWHMYHYAQREIRITRENARLQLIAKEIQLENLTAQLNPHFFFNSLNTIKSLVLEDPSQARRAIDLLSELLRTSLYNRTDQLISIAEELQLVKDYLELEKLRLEERLIPVFDIDTTLLDIRIPPLSIQTLVENAIKHSISRLKNGGTITVTVTRNKTGVQIIVHHPGRLQEHAPAGLGLKNLRERLQLQFQGKADFAVTSATGTVTAVIQLPDIPAGGTP
ncbi:sensor histidine kinase [Chitinophaga solisilvae]|uniref:sensor histidine kinase n=1 Tax=Chitinophaga solisilvae TaxID=1233460 RepID=UPI00136DD9D4|nr:histidine kinase [Chitinophaga solisilvae]